MPNWCHNTFKVSGDKKEVEVFIRENEGEVDGIKQMLLFSKSVPEPEYTGEKDHEPYPGWYDWRIENWGVKWELSSDGVDQAEREVREIAGRVIETATYRFDTPWGTCGEWLERTAVKYPRLSFILTYGEPGGDFGGTAIFKNGKLVDESYGSAAEYLAEDMMWC